MFLPSAVISSNADLVCSTSLQWCHNERDGFSNHRPYDCLLNRLFGLISKITSKLCVTGLCVGNSPVMDEFPAQMANNAENVSLWWRHHLQSTSDMFFQVFLMSFLYLAKIDSWYINLICLIVFLSVWLEVANSVLRCWYRSFSGLHSFSFFYRKSLCFIEFMIPYVIHFDLLYHCLFAFT